MIGNEFN